MALICLVEDVENGANPQSIMKKRINCMKPKCLLQCFSFSVAHLVCFDHAKKNMIHMIAHMNHIFLCALI